MGQMIDFPSNGGTAQGYLALPSSGSGPGVVIIQEWWGLNDQLREVCDAWAADGFVALAPDLYHGVVTREPDEAGKLMMALNIEQAAKDMVGAVDRLAAHDAVVGDGVGVVGFCMGGALALWLATLRPERVRAVAPFYGVVGWPATQPDWSRLAGPVQGHYAENDDSAAPAAVAKFADELRALGKEVEIFTYPGTQHAFTNHHRAEVYDAKATALAFDRAKAFLRANLVD
ncbi:MAG: carboxymethylenebutenolidase [Actinomycetota bacterium]|jgi:carboxymethylenebutenolidase|nr:carboxymethylenebutenolidase [Actinomycetota bacterium]